MTKAELIPLRNFRNMTLPRASSSFIILVVVIQRVQFSKKGKSSIDKLFMRNSNLYSFSHVFYTSTSTHREVSDAGEQMFLAMYNARVRDLDKQCYLAFLKSTTSVMPDLSSLPPAKGSVLQHTCK
ncbi:hypothetical protein X975_15611, partial [Stegodyphus mimosarum]